MTDAFPASPTMIDLDMDGYVDRVYIGDWGDGCGFLTSPSIRRPKKSNSLWSGAVLFSAPSLTSEKHPIYGAAAVALDQNKKPGCSSGPGTGKTRKIS